MAKRSTLQVAAWLVNVRQMTYINNIYMHFSVKDIWKKAQFGFCGGI